MSDAVRDVDRQIARLRALDGVGERAAAAALGPLTGVVRGHLAAGQAPDGTPWPERKAGGRALAKAANAVTLEARGASVVMQLDSVHARHNSWGGIRGGTRRQQLPDTNQVPDAYLEVVDAAVQAELAKTLAGGSP